MKFILAFVAILSLAAADDLSDLKTFLKCLHKVIDVGMPSIGVPPHEPLNIEDFHGEGGNIAASFSANVTDNWLHGLLNYTFPTLEVAQTTSNPNTVTYKYAIYWPLLNFTGNWGLDLGTFFVKTHSAGTYNIVLEHLTWSGIFNLTKPGQTAYPEKLNVFSLASEVKNVEVHVTGAGLSKLAVETTLYGALSVLLNNFPANAADTLKDDRFNDFWISHPEKIQAMMQFCGLKN